VDDQVPRRLQNRQALQSGLSTSNYKHFCVEEIEKDKSVVLTYSSTDQIRADIFTKELPATELILSLHLQRILEVWSQIEGGCESIS
jgi:hypothetical protein